MNQYRPAKKRIEVSVGESVRIIRELQGLSQNRLAELSGIPQATLYALIQQRHAVMACRWVAITRRVASSASRFSNAPVNSSIRTDA
jgi:transcriptional regulator with XRE-family HTH domain